MSFPLQPTVRIAAAVLAAGTLALATAAQAAGTPEQQCHAGKSKVAGQYYACLQKASAKVVTSLDASKFNAAVAACDAKYDGAWEKQDVKAAAAGTACFDGATTDLEFRNVIAGSWSTVQAALAGAPLPDCGNGSAEAPESCDESDLDGATCATQPGFVGGTLRCGSGCTLDTSGCYASRFVDNLDGTVTDNQTGLQWEKKTSTVGSGANLADPHDVDNTYSWSTLLKTDGTGFLDQINCVSADGTTVTGGFAGHCDWRLPTIAELRTIMLEPAPCSTQPCIDPIFGPTQAHFYWSSTTVAGGGAWIGNAWIGNFYQGNASLDSKTLSHRVRAVRGPS